MSSLLRRSSIVVGAGALSLAAAGVLAPGALAADTIDGDVTVSNTETVQVLMSASGKIDAQRVYEQLVLRGDGKVDISNPVSAKGLRNLDGFGGFDVQDGEQRVKTDVDGIKKYRSVSDFTKKLPIDIDITYTFDGKKVEPGDIVGKSGDLEVRYVVTNTTGKTEEVAYQDGNGQQKSSTEEVVVPMVGSLTTVLPSTFTKVQSAEANAAGDGRGGTQLSFTMTLIPPIGKATAEFGYEAKVTDGVIPKATVSVLPVNPLESPSFKGGATSYKGGADTGQDLTAGATEIDANVLKLRDGANDLVAGIMQLQQGANQLSTGLQNDAVPGAGKLADGADKLNAGANDLKGGTGDLTAGADKLKEGAGTLSGKLREAKDGAPALKKGVADLLAGAQLVDKGLATLNAQVVPGATGISTGATSLLGALDAQLLAGLDGALQYIGGAAQIAGTLPDSPQKTGIADALLEAKTLVTSVRTGLDTTVRGGLTGIKNGASAIATGVKNTTENKIPPDANGDGATLKYGTSALVAGLTDLQKKATPLIDGLPLLSAGADQLADGTDDLKSGADQLNSGAGQLRDGTNQLSAGAGELASGLGTAASGSGELAAGLDEAAESAPALPEGAEQLSKEGTSVLVDKGDATAVDYGMKYALIEAGASRAASAQPYGSPEGATALTAYKFEIAGEDGAGSANVRRGVAALVLMAGAGAFATFRRRGLI